MLSDCSTFSITHGTLIGASAHGSTVSVQCKDGYTLAGHSSFACVDGNWNSSAPACFKGIC